MGLGVEVSIPSISSGSVNRTLVSFVVPGDFVGVESTLADGSRRRNRGGDSGGLRLS